MRPLINWTGSDLKCNLIQSFWRCIHTHTHTHTRHLGIFLKGRFWLSSPARGGLNFCISDKLPRNAILWVATKAVLFHFLSWPWHWTICWLGLPFWESFLILGLVNNLGDGSSLTILRRRLCIWKEGFLVVRGTLFVDTCWLASVRVWQHPSPNSPHFPHQIFLLILLALVKFHVTNTGWLLSGDQYILFY